MCGLGVVVCVFFVDGVGVGGWCCVCVWWERDGGVSNLEFRREDVLMSEGRYEGS